MALLYPFRLKKILCTIDFTGASAAALPYAAALGRRFTADILVLHVILPEEYEHLAAGQLDAALAEMKQSARVRIERILAAARFADVSFRLTIEHGEVLPVVAALAQREQADLIVAGSHGRHGIKKLLAPAVDEEIAEAAGRPVLLIGPDVSIARGRGPHRPHPLRHRLSSAVAACARLHLRIRGDIWCPTLCHARRRRHLA